MASIGSLAGQGWGRAAAAAAAVVLATAVAAAFGLANPLAVVMIAVSGALTALLIPVASAHHSQSAAPAIAPSADPMSAPLFEALPDPAILVRPGGVVARANSAAFEALRGLAIGQPISFALRVPEVLEALRAVAAGGEARAIEYTDRVPVERWTRARVTAVGAHEGGAPEFVLLLLGDLTPLRQAERMRVDFIANASHELRTPLAAILGFVETLQGPARNDPDARARFLDIMRGQANRMARLVDDLLSLSRIEQKQHMRPVTPIDLEEAVRAVLDGLAPLAAERGVEIVPELPREGPVTVLGDRDELIRVVENLVENAIKYGQAGGRVEVSLAADARQARLAIRDHGPGIAPEHLPRLTERFYRVDVGQSREKGGTGLGLAIVKHIVARHRARLLIDSVLGEGATFTIVIDRVANENSATEDGAAEGARLSSHRHMADVERI